MSKVQFKLLDLFFFSFIGALLECLNLWAFSQFSGMYYVSFAVVLGLIAMVRWDWAGVVVTLITGAASVVFDIATGESVGIEWILANTIGYLPLLLNVFWFKGMKRKPGGKDYGYILGYVLTGFLVTEIGRSLCYIGSSTSIQSVLLQCVAYDLINFAIGLVVFIIACKQKKLLYDMNTYLVEQHTGNEESRARSERDDYISLEQMAEKDEISDIALLDGGVPTPEDLEKLNEVKKRMEGKSSKYDEEKKALSQLEESRKTKKKNSEGDSK